MKTYTVNISQTWSQTVVVKANNIQEAKSKAWKKYIPKKQNYKVTVDVD